MRLSCDPESEYYDPVLIHRTRVLLDGQAVHYCHFADEEHGVVVVTKFDADGHIVLDGEYIVCEKLQGVVKIVNDEAAAAQGSLF
jgi:hypothetical protein